MKTKFIALLAFLGAVDCVFVPVLFGAAIQQPFFPLPGLYFLEIALLGVVGLFHAMRNPAGKGDGGTPWGIAGVLLAFNVLGAWTIGLYLIPGTLAFLGVGWLLAEKGQKDGRGLGIFLLAALGQGILMLVLVNLL